MQWLMPVGRAQPPFETFFADHCGAVVGFLRGLCGSADAEECAQEAFLAALRRYEDFDGSNPRAWILTIARRKAIDRRRADSRRPRPGPTALIDLPAPPGREAGSSAGAFALVAELPQKQREAVALRYLGDLSYREVGELMETSEAAARRNVHEAISKLRERMGVGSDHE